MNKRLYFIILPALLAILVGMACASSAPGITPTPTSTSSPATATAPVPSEEPTGEPPTIVPTSEPTTAPTSVPPTAIPVSTDYLDNRSDPYSVMESFVNALNRHEYLRAYSYWEDGAQKPAFNDFEQGYANTESVVLTVGEITGSAGAGQIYYSVPVTMVATTSSATQTFVGCYVLHLGSPSAQATPPYRPLGISQAQVQQVDNGTDTGDLMASACDASSEGEPPYATPTPSAPDDISANRYLDDRSGPVALIRSYFNAINNHEYLRAYSYWESSTDLPSFNEFEQGYMDTASVTLETGEVASDSGAGQTYYSVPVTLTSTQTDGTTQTYVGCYVLHLSSPSAQATPPFRGLSIQKADAQPVAADADTAALMADACNGITASSNGSETAGLTITQADNGKTIDVADGGDFLLKLGSDYDWSITIDNPDVVSRVVNIMVVKGAQGVYQAHQPGHAILSATGTPICPAGQMCSNLALAFQVQINVQ